MPRISVDNYDTVASWNGSQDLFIVEQPDGTKVATPALIKQYIEAGDFEATGEVKDGHGNILKNMAKSTDVDTIIGDLSQTGLTGDSVAEQLTEINTALDNSKIAVFTQTFNNVTIANAWGSLYESSQQRFDISSLGLQSPPKAVYIGLKQAQNALMFELLSPLATSIPFHFIRPNQMTTAINITATALVIY